MVDTEELGKKIRIWGTTEFGEFPLQSFLG
jgi:hypothetical protein